MIFSGCDIMFDVLGFDTCPVRVVQIVIVIVIDVVVVAVFAFVVVVMDAEI